MYRLLIVDDEEIIVNGLYEIFSSLKQMDLDVYKAYSGEEAIGWLNRTRIDIVLTDIRMPGIDGMQLLTEILKSWPNCKVIFLTGHSEFNYVYRAIQHSNVSYILKNEDHEKVIAAVDDAIKDIQKGMKIDNLVQMAQEQMDMALDLFQTGFMIHLLHDRKTTGINREQFDRLGISMSPNHPVILLIGHVDGLPPENSYWEKINLLYSVRLLMNQYLAHQIVSINTMDEDYDFITLIQPEDLPAGTGDQAEERSLYDRVNMFVRGTLEVIQSACRESVQVTINFTMAGEPCAWEDISRKYNSLKQLLNFRIGKGIESILIDTDVQNWMIHASPQTASIADESNVALVDTLQRQRSMDVMCQYLESGNRDQYFKQLAELVDPIRVIPDKNSAIAVEAYFKVALSLLSYLNRWKLGDSHSLRLRQSTLMDVRAYDSWSEAADALYTLSEILFKLQSDEQKSRADTTIEYLQKFIRGHLGEDLSLIRLAEQVYLNPSYLSRLFRQVKGINLSDYIERERILKAKELLTKETIKINEVARQTGYETAASFTRFFKKMVGCSPLEYQEGILTGKQRQND